MPYRSKTLEQSSERRERTFIKILLGIVLGLVLLIGGIWVGYDGYVRWQEKRLLRRADLALSQGDYRSASLSARAVLQSKPGSVGAARIMAQVAERAGDRVAIDWRRKIAESSTATAEDTLAWARAALQFSDAATAERALGRLDEAGRQTAGYFAVSALLAQNRREEEKADHFWTEALRLLPEEKAYQMQLGILRLSSRDPAKHAAGERILQELRQSPENRAVATRALINDAVSRRGREDEMLALARELQGYPEATQSDRLLFLDFLHRFKNSEFIPYLTEFQKNAATNPVALTQLLSWMSTRNLNLLAVNFVESLPPADLEKWPVPLGLADVYLRLGDWPKLEALTKSGNWRQSNFLRRAFLARASRGQEKTVAAQREWSAAVKEASAQSAALLSLVQLTVEWGWTDEAIELLWALAKHPDKQNEAFASLYKHYSKTQDTQGLYRLTARLLEQEPDNPDIKNNLAQIGLLLNAKPEEARRAAAEIYRKAPSNAAYAATYAYSLMTKGDAPGAVAVMKTLTEEQLRDPAVAAYYGIFLAAVKDERARAFLELAQNATLLPEEKALVAKAESALR
jgi:predicted Zn-dependent protease